jgi:hypothetical protein
METKRIAIFSGGGAKGLIQASCFAELQRLKMKDFNTGYDLIVGSSVGSINGAVFALNIMDPQTLLKTYPDMLDQIFKRKLFRIPKYDRDNFVEGWKKIVDPSLLLKDCKTKLSVSSVERCSDTNHFFKSWEEKDGMVTVVDALMRSFAAPFFFGQIVDYVDRKVWYDGGCGSYNIPIDFGYTEAKLLGWLGKYEVHIDAYGTGFSSSEISFQEAAGEKFLKQLLSFMVPAEGGMARVQSRMDQVRRMAKISSCDPTIHFEYYDIEIPKELDQMDDLKHKKEYIEYGKKMAQKPLVCD